MSAYAIEVKNLNKNYGRLQAVDNLSFKVEKGTSFGLLGLNGAGKTTTLKMLVSLIKPNSGTATISGHDILKEPMKVRRSIGYVSENPSFYTRMTTMETLQYIGKLLDIPTKLRQERIETNLELVGLVDKRDNYVGEYSRGMRHRLSLAQALLSEPEVLFLDEPTLGLDPLGAKGMRELIIKLKTTRQVTIVMSSHVLPEVEAICNEVGVFDHGKLVAQDSVANLRHTSSNDMNIEVVLMQRDDKLAQAVEKLDYVNHVQIEDNRLIINTPAQKEIRPQLLEAIWAVNKQILSFGIKENSLEDILLRILKKQG
jgi:ABC-2 type transport system ATP-binding protein